jgi:hypothetical protein
MEDVPLLRAYPSSRMENEQGGQVMIAALILGLGLTFFPGQPYWHELDTAGVEWTVNQGTVAQSSDCPVVRCKTSAITGEVICRCSQY